MEAYCQVQGLSLKPESRFPGLCANMTLGPDVLRLMIPSTFMNLCGNAIQKFLHFYQITPEQLLVVHDELDLPVGAARLKQGGGHGGHNGLRDLIQHIGNDFCRLRLGIGRPAHPSHAVADFVLAPPNHSDKQAILTAIDQVLPFVPDLVAGQWNRCVKQLHTNGDTNGV